MPERTRLLFVFVATVAAIMAVFTLGYRGQSSLMIFTVLSAFVAVLAIVAYSANRALGYKNYYAAVQDCDITENSAEMSDTGFRLCIQLRGTHVPYVIEAICRLGQLREAATIPALLNLLDHRVARRDAGWEDVCVAVLTTLDKIGDPRVLSALMRMCPIESRIVNARLDETISILSEINAVDFTARI